MSVPSWAVVGAKVVCVDAYAPPRVGVDFEQYPVEGEVYTIRAISVGYTSPGILLVEIVNPSMRYTEGYGEMLHAISRFRPLISQSDDLEAHFNQHLSRSAPVKMEEEA